MVVLRADDGGAVARLVASLDQVPPELRASVRRAMKPIGEQVVNEARGNAGWSSRIPGSISLRVSFARNPGVSIFAGRGKAPHGRPFEGIRGNASFRHPVFGNRSVWVAQATRPFLRPALDGRRPQIALQLNEAVMAAVARSGLR